MADTTLTEAVVTIAVTKAKWGFYAFLIGLILFIGGIVAFYYFWYDPHCTKYPNKLYCWLN
jgi:hypothetical protein